MILNRYEESQIKNAKLPDMWQNQTTLDELEQFLQQNWEQREVFYEDGKVESRQQFLAFTGQKGVRTKNYIGTISFKGEQLNIFPKMFRTEGDDQETDELSQEHLMKNLVRWLEYCNRMSYPFISISSELDDSEDLKELFISLYIGYVRHALERGLYYRYVEECEDIGFIKGKFDVKDYYLRKVPNGQSDKFNCTYSNFEFDNEVNRIIKCTCKLLLNITSKKNQKALRNILIRLNEVEDVQCKPNDCNKIRLSKMHRNYRVIISMSKMFLLNKTSTFATDIHDSFCFLFPSELLFEGFIGGFMQEVIEETGGKVYLQKSDMSIIEDIQIGNKSFGSAFKMRHDIVVELNGHMFILDTKYKQIERFQGDAFEAARIVRESVNEDDVRQVCDYARKRGTSEVFLLYPQYRFEDLDEVRPIGRSLSEKGGSEIHIHFVRLPFIFEKDEEQTKQLLKKAIVDILG